MGSVWTGIKRLTLAGLYYQSFSSPLDDLSVIGPWSGDNPNEEYETAICVNYFPNSGFEDKLCDEYKKPLCEIQQLS